MGYLDLCRAFSSVTFFIFFSLYIIDVSMWLTLLMALLFFFFASLPAVTFTKVQCYLHHSL